MAHLCSSMGISGALPSRRHHRAGWVCIRPWPGLQARRREMMRQDRMEEEAKQNDLDLAYEVRFAHPLKITK